MQRETAPCECLFLCMREGQKEGEAFQWNSHFVQIKKAWAMGRGFHGREGLDYLWWGGGVDIPQDEVGHCSLSPLKRAF